MKKYITKKYIIWAAVLAVVILGIIFFRGGNDGQNLVTVARKDVIQEVVVTGKTKADSQVDLGFDASGRVARVSASVGSAVTAGQIIAELDINSDLANLAREQALLAEEELNLSREGERVEGSLREAYSAADNAVRNKIDQFFKTPRTNPSFEVKFTDGNFVHYFVVPSDVSIDINNMRKLIEVALTNWQVELVKLDEGNAKSFVSTSIQRMNQISNFLDKVAYAVNSFTPAEFAYDSTVTGYKTAVDSARSSVSSARQSLIEADSAGLEKLSQQRSAVQAVQANLLKSRIVAPFSGTVTRQDAKPGQVANTGESLVTLISESNMYVEANVSEVNISKVKVGDKVQVGFDAYPEESLSGTVSFIDPGESIVDKVVNYKIRIDLDMASTTLKIKSGLTANVRIVTAQTTGALSVPIYTTIKEGEQTFVNKIVDGKVVKTEIQTGLMGSDGFLEILSGLEEGDSVEYSK